MRPYDRYDGVVESEEVGTRMAAALGDGCVLALRNHGIVAVGRNLREAVCAAVIYEENCSFQLAAMAAGRLVSLDGEEAEQARKAARSRPFLTQRDISQ